MPSGISALCRAARGKHLEGRRILALKRNPNVMRVACVVVGDNTLREVLYDRAWVARGLGEGRRAREGVSRSVVFSFASSCLKNAKTV